MAKQQIRSDKLRQPSGEPRSRPDDQCPLASRHRFFRRKCRSRGAGDPLIAQKEYRKPASLAARQARKQPEFGRIAQRIWGISGAKALRFVPNS